MLPGQLLALEDTRCGAGVGRTRTMAAAYLVRSGEETPTRAVRRNLAVGPPSIEQIYYALCLGPGRPGRPPFPVVAVSRPVDAPRRMLSWFWNKTFPDTG